jgi:hypothetical protein
MYPMGAREPGIGKIRKKTGVEAAVNAGASLERSMARETRRNRNWEGDVTEGGDDSDPLIADKGKAFFFCT